MATLCRPSWPQINKDLPASTSLMQGIKMCTTTAGYLDYVLNQLQCKPLGTPVRSFLHLMIWSGKTYHKMETVEKIGYGQRKAFFFACLLSLLLASLSLLWLLLLHSFTDAKISFFTFQYRLKTVILQESSGLSALIMTGKTLRTVDWTTTGFLVYPVWDSYHCTAQTM